jgi:hypothetical protein
MGPVVVEAAPVDPNGDPVCPSAPVGPVSVGSGSVAPVGTVDTQEARGEIGTEDIGDGSSTAEWWIGDHRYAPVGPVGPVDPALWAVPVGPCAPAAPV